MSLAAESVGGWLMAAATLLGHCFFCVGAVNRVHALGLPRFAIKSISALWHGWLILAVVGASYWIGRIGFDAFLAAHRWHGGEGTVVSAYAIVCWLALFATAARWAVMRMRRQPAAITAESTQQIDLANRAGGPPIAGRWTTAAARWPGNQLLSIAVARERVELPNLPPALEGLSIVHLSDLHMSGRLSLDYFCEISRLANSLDPDLVVISGDICDCAALVAWIPAALSRIRSRYGKFFVLGNHDLRSKQIERLRTSLAQSGWTDLGGCGTMLDIGGQPVWLDGDERPWLVRPCETQSATTVVDPPTGESADGAALRILVAHSPDRFHSAQRRGFELMFCGHTHGGQVRLPVIGPLLCPSRHGVRYASGWFAGRPTLMRVSRGSGSLFPIRLNCRPEVARVTLTSGRLKVTQPTAPSTGERG